MVSVVGFGRGSGETAAECGGEQAAGDILGGRRRLGVEGGCGDGECRGGAGVFGRVGFT